MGFTSMDSINYRWKIFKKEKIQQNLGLLLTSNYVSIIYIMLCIIDVSIQRWFKVFGGMCIGYMQILHHFYRNLSVCGFLVSVGPGTSPLWILRDDYINFKLILRNPFGKYLSRLLILHLLSLSVPGATSELAVSKIICTKNSAQNAAELWVWHL